jgi:hypothetical protein
MSIEQDLTIQSQAPVIAHEDGPRIVIRDASFALQPLPPIEWIVDRLISEGSVCIFFGEPGAKKTFALLSLAVCVALGKPWLGFETKPRNVLIIDEESGERRLALRLGNAIRGELGGADIPIQFISLAGFNLSNKDDGPLLQTIIQESGAGLVVIDALAEIMSGDENSKEDVHPVLIALRRIADQTGAAIAAIHHSNKSGGYRGSSAIKGAVDLMVKIESATGNRYINFTSEKSRDAEPVNFSGLITWLDDQFYISGSKRESSPEEQFILDYLGEHGASSLPDLQAAGELHTPSGIKLAVYSLAKSGKVYRTNPGKSGRGVKAIYDMKEPAEIKT